MGYRADLHCGQNIFIRNNHTINQCADCSKNLIEGIFSKYQRNNSETGLNRVNYFVTKAHDFCIINYDC